MPARSSLPSGPFPGRTEDRPHHGLANQPTALRRALAGPPDSVHDPARAVGVPMALLLIVEDMEGWDEVSLLRLVRLVRHLARTAAAGEAAGERETESAASIASQTSMTQPMPLLRPASASSIPLDIRCFGGFQLRRGTARLDCGALRPKVRSLLQLLAIHAGRPVHREELLDALWPDLDVPAGIRNLQVAVSQLRAFLEPGTGRGSRRRLSRDGASYALTLLPDDRSDVYGFECAVQDWKRARGSGTAEAALTTLRRAAAYYTGDLLPEAGPMEWVAGERLRLRALASDVMGALAEAELGLGHADAAKEAARASLELDAYRDSSWRVLIAAHREAGSHAAAARANREYARMLRSLAG